jgi:hypothetical protein
MWHSLHQIEANEERKFSFYEWECRRVPSDLGKLEYGFSIKRFPGRTCTTHMAHSAAIFVYDAPFLILVFYCTRDLARHDHIRLLGIRIG